MRLVQWLIERSPADYLRVLLISLTVLALCVLVIALAEFSLPPGLFAESLALVSLLCGIPALVTGMCAFLLLILSRLAVILGKNDDS